MYALIDNGIRGQPMKDSHNEPYKYFFDVIEGKGFAKIYLENELIIQVYMLL
jgi:hypothetical protein